MQVRVDELRVLVGKLLTHLEETGHSVVDLDVDYYWTVPEKARYDPYREPGKPDLGQLTDDWAELRKILTGDDAPLNYALVWLASVLRRVGEVAGEAGPPKRA